MSNYIATLYYKSVIYENWMFSYFLCLTFETKWKYIFVWTNAYFMNEWMHNEIHIFSCLLFNPSKIGRFFLIKNFLLLKFSFLCSLGIKLLLNNITVTLYYKSVIYIFTYLILYMKIGCLLIFYVFNIWDQINMWAFRFKSN